MLFTSSMVVTCSLVCLLVSCFLLLFGSSLRVWGPRAVVGSICSFSLVCCLLFYFVYLSFAGFGSYTDSWSNFFFGALWCSGPAPTSGPVVLLFSVSGEVKI
jgi:hypothetical protein